LYVYCLPCSILSLGNFICTSSSVLISIYYYFPGKICQKEPFFIILFVVAKNMLVVYCFRHIWHFYLNGSCCFSASLGLSKCAQIIIVIGNKWIECVLWLTRKCSVNCHNIWLWCIVLPFVFV
jgi:hypothetical protein